LWDGDEPTEAEAKYIAQRCRQLQADMLLFSRNGNAFTVGKVTETIKDLVNSYQTDASSRHHKKRYKTKLNHTTLLKRIVDKCGDDRLAEVRARSITLWHDDWSDGGNKLPMGHAFMSLLRTIFGFGATMLENAECERLCAVMHHMKFEGGIQPQEEALTAEQVDAIRAKAHEFGYHSVALAQGLQFDLMFRQKDIIGEWVPVSEPGVTDYVRREWKWLRGLRWSEIDANWILRHTTSKKNKKIEIDLKLAPMAMEELERYIAFLGERPTQGPIVIHEGTAWPWVASEFRRKWRMIATAAGVPLEVKNMHSRAGAISEATEAGAQLEHVKHAATHSNINMTERYARLRNKKVKNVQMIRMEARKQTKNNDD
jgi:integrase